MSCEANLIHDALTGERAAARRLERRLRPAITATIHRLLRTTSQPRAEAPDLIQDAWLFLLEDGAHRLRAFDHCRGVPLEKYVAVLVARRTLTHFAHQKTQKRRRPAGDPAPGDRSSTPEQAVACAELLQALAENLPQRAKQVLDAVILQGRSPAAAAAILGVSTQVIRNWQHRIRREAEKYFTP